MLSKLFLGLSLTGAEWVLYLLIALSVISVAVIFERVAFYWTAQKGIKNFRKEIKTAASQGQWDRALKTAQTRVEKKSRSVDFESTVSAALLKHQSQSAAKSSPELLSEVAQDALLQTKVAWEKKLVVLATIGSNAPFIGLFGTVLGIIQAFHDLSQKSGGGVQTVTSGISESLVATAIGILVAIPAVVAFNFFQKKVKSSLAEAEALKSYLIGEFGKN